MKPNYYLVIVFMPYVYVKNVVLLARKVIKSNHYFHHADVRVFVCFTQTYHVEETQQELCDDEVMFRKTFHDLFTPADPQTALHVWQKTNNNSAFVRIRVTHDSLTVTWPHSLSSSWTWSYTLKVSSGSGSSRRNVLRITAGTWTSQKSSKFTGFPEQVQIIQIIFINTSLWTTLTPTLFSCLFSMNSYTSESAVKGTVHGKTLLWEMLNNNSINRKFKQKCIVLINKEAKCS